MILFIGLPISTPSENYCFLLVVLYPDIRETIFAYLFSVHNTVSLSRDEQVCFMTSQTYGVLYPD